MMKLVLVLALVGLAVYFSGAGLGGVKKEAVIERVAQTVREVGRVEPVKNLLLPDLVVAKPRQLTIQLELGKKKLRFSTTFVNQGVGPLEIIGHTDRVNDVTYAAQYISEVGGPGIYQDIGKFVFHPDHKHWHVADYVVYKLIRKLNGGAEEVAAATDKMSFCIWDEDRERPDIATAPAVPVYSANCERQVQGMSVGWSDTYQARVEGQEMEITSVPDGEYVFRVEVNPERRIKESTYDNNVTLVDVVITGSRLVVK